MTGLRAPAAHELAEAQVVGAVLLAGDCFADVAGRLTVSDFSDRNTGRLFAAASQLFAAGEQLTVANILAAAGDSDSLRNLALDLRADCGSSGHIKADARTVAQAARKRALAAAAAGIGQTAGDPAVKFDTALESAQTALAGLADSASDNGPIPLADGLADQLRDLERHQRAGGGVRGLTTGIPDLDRVLLGLRPGQVVVMAGRTGSGKTALALQVADHVAETGGKVLYFSAEMPAADLVERILARRASIDHTRIRSASLSPADWVGITKIANEYSSGAGLRLLVDDMGGVTCGRIASALARERARGGTALFVVDHLQLLRPSGRKSSLYESTSESSGLIKSLAMRFGVPVLLLSQLNRSSGRGGRRPRLSDLRDSGSIEQDADAVVFINRDVQADREAVTLSVAKNRSGRLGEVDLRFDLARQHFTEVEL